MSFIEQPQQRDISVTEPSLPPVHEVELIRDLAMVNVLPIATNKRRFESARRHAFALSDRKDPYSLEPECVDTILAVSLGKAAVRAHSMYISFFEQQIAANKRHVLQREMYRFVWQQGEILSADLVTTSHKFTLSDLRVGEDGALIEVTQPRINTVSRELTIEDCDTVTNRMLTFAYGIDKKAA